MNSRKDLFANLCLGGGWKSTMGCKNSRGNSDGRLDTLAGAKFKTPNANKCKDCKHLRNGKLDMLPAKEGMALRNLTGTKHEKVQPL